MAEREGGTGREKESPAERQRERERERGEWHRNLRLTAARHPGGHLELKWVDDYVAVSKREYAQVRAQRQSESLEKKTRGKRKRKRKWRRRRRGDLSSHVPQIDLAEAKLVWAGYGIESKVLLSAFSLSVGEEKKRKSKL